MSVKVFKINLVLYNAYLQEAQYTPSMTVCCCYYQLIICQCLLLVQEPCMYLPKDVISFFSMIMVLEREQRSPGLSSK